MLSFHERAFDRMEMGIQRPEINETTVSPSTDSGFSTEHWPE
jgi:hypothetical protein